jgi:hypothetical protein
MGDALNSLAASAFCPSEVYVASAPSFLGTTVHGARAARSFDLELLLLRFHAQTADLPLDHGIQ